MRRLPVDAAPSRAGQALGSQLSCLRLLQHLAILQHQAVEGALVQIHLQLRGQDQPAHPQAWHAC